MFEIETPQPADAKGFYDKQLEILGIKILGADYVADAAFYAAAEIVGNLLVNNPGLLSELQMNGAYVAILGEVTEYVYPNIISAEDLLTDLPEYANLYQQFPGSDWDSYRGVGGVVGNPISSVGEENLLNTPADPYFGSESILLHEFGHGIMNLGLNFTDIGDDIEDAYANAVDQGLWTNTYAGSNVHEYFAEITQSWFNDNPAPNAGVHNDINTRAELQTYDPVGYALLASVYRDDSWEPGSFLGTAGADTLAGTANNDVIFAQGGDDRFDAGGGSDIVDGGAGVDRVAYAGGRDGIAITVEDDGIAVLKASGTDTLYHVERVEIDGGTLLFDIDSENVEFAYRIYAAAYGRTPDEPGLRFWTDVLDGRGEGPPDTADKEFIASFFLTADEYISKYGENPTNEQFINKLYENVLHREADQAGYDFWLGVIASGQGKDDLLIWFTDSDENVVNTAPDLDGGIWVL